MSESIPKELYYTETHEWVRVEEDGSVYVGITDHAQAEMGELVFADLPDLGVRSGTLQMRLQCLNPSKLRRIFMPRFLERLSKLMKI